jgi:hypothetical protein
MTKVGFTEHCAKTAKSSSGFLQVLFKRQLKDFQVG